MRTKAAFHNLGCKVNAYETESIRQTLIERGYEIVDFAPGADIYIINTCTVTNIADRKSRQMLHRAKKMNPDALVVAIGCYAQAGGEKLSADPAIDLVIGNNEKRKLPDLLDIWRETKSLPDDFTCLVQDLSRPSAYEEMSITGMTEHTRAYLKVQDGCNQFCSYCIIPYARGRVRSRKKEDVIEEVRRLAKAGCQEIVLTGIHLSSYGVDFGRADLAGLIREVHQVEGIRRIRLGSLEPGIVTPAFAAELAGMVKVCPHFHLSLQSGCDRTLRRMNRRYTADEYREKCRILREVYDDPALTTDIITGFPGETEEDFAESMEFVREISFYETHIFKYSRRQGTRAAAMPDQIPEDTKAERSARMIRMGKQKKREYLQRFSGRILEVLTEEQITREGVSCWIGHTPEYLKAAVPAASCAGVSSNEFLRIRAEEILEDGVILGSLY